MADGSLCALPGEMETPSVNNPSRCGVSRAEDIQEHLKSAVPKLTQAATKFWVKVFDEYVASKGKEVDFATISPESLAQTLESFYTDVLKKDGTHYQRIGYLNARSAIKRHVDSMNRKPPMNTARDNKFCRASRVLDAVLRDNKRQGHQAVVQHKNLIKKDDLDRLMEYFADVLTTSDPHKLTST